MFFSFSSLLSIVLISSTLFLVIGFCLKSLKQVRKRYIHAILACMAIILVRLVFPIEFTFEKTLGIWHILPPIYRFFHSTLFQIHGTAVTVNLAVGVVWGIGILVSAGNLFLSYSRFIGAVKRRPLIYSGTAYDVLQSILKEQPRPAEIKLVSADFVDTPMLCGFGKPCIVIPEIELSEEDWMHILRHEVAHYRHKDLYIKLAAECLRILVESRYLFCPGTSKPGFGIECGRCGYKGFV